MRNRITAGLLSLTLLLSAAAAQTEPHFKELPNLRKVNEHFYGGAQPASGGIRKLVVLGIKTVVNLRGSDGSERTEESEVKDLGLRYYSVPMPGLSRPSDEQIARVMAIVDDQENWPVFIHCKHGSDRTGTVIACYRISHDNWTGERAISEAKHYGMSWVEFGMRDYIADYYARQSRKGQKAEAATVSR